MVVAAGANPLEDGCYCLVPTNVRDDDSCVAGRIGCAGRPMPDGRRPEPGRWNRIELVVSDLPAEVERLRAAGLRFRNDVVKGPGESQILLEDPSGNLVELFQPAGH